MPLESPLMALELDISKQKGYISGMWPNVGVGANLGRVYRYPTCRENGVSHRYAVPRNLGKSQTRFVKFCRLCSAKVLIEFDPKTGQMRDSVIDQNSSPSGSKDLV